MKIIVAGASGLIGSGLCAAFTSRGDTALRLVRGTARGPDEIAWDPSAGQLDAQAIENADAVVCLSGESIAGGRWTPTRKQRILNSRVHSAALLARTLATCAQPPRTFICASAVGYYGTGRGDAQQTEASPPGNDFLAEVCVAWEAAAEPARAKGVRVVHLRTGVVLSAQGGALKTMLTPFRLGLGGVIGPGTQYMSWITLDELVNAILFVVDSPELSGPINCVSPNAVTNRVFTKALGRASHRPTLIPMPAFVVSTLFGEMGESLLLGGVNAVPEKLMHAGYTFMHPELDEALRHVLAQ